MTQTVNQIKQSDYRPFDSLYHRYEIFSCLIAKYKISLLKQWRLFESYLFANPLHGISRGEADTHRKLNIDSPLIHRHVVESTLNLCLVSNVCLLGWGKDR